MAMEMSVTRTQPQRTVTDWPSVKVMYKVVLRPKGTAMMANELQNKEQHQHAVVYTVQRSSQQKIKTDNRKKKKKSREKETYSPRILIMLRCRGNSLLYPILASASSALASTDAWRISAELESRSSQNEKRRGRWRRAGDDKEGSLRVSFNCKPSGRRRTGRER